MTVAAGVNGLEHTMINANIRHLPNVHHPTHIPAPRRLHRHILQDEAVGVGSRALPPPTAILALTIKIKATMTSHRTIPLVPRFGEAVQGIVEATTVAAASLTPVPRYTTMGLHPADGVISAIPNAMVQAPGAEVRIAVLILPLGILTNYHKALPRLPLKTGCQ